MLATKAVGDFLGTRGIAEETIRFNGFPFLEKEDHSFNVSGTPCKFALELTRLNLGAVDRVMRKELHTFYASGMRVQDVGKFSLLCCKPAFEVTHRGSIGRDGSQRLPRHFNRPIADFDGIHWTNRDSIRPRHVSFQKSS